MARNAELLWGQPEALADAEHLGAKGALQDVLDLPQHLWPTQPIRDVEEPSSALRMPALADGPVELGGLAGMDVGAVPASSSDEPEPIGKPHILGKITIHTFPYTILDNRTRGGWAPLRGGKT